jgi:hypothetical protein
LGATTHAPLVQVWPAGQHDEPHTCALSQHRFVPTQVCATPQQAVPQVVPPQTVVHTPETHDWPLAQHTPLHAWLVGQQAFEMQVCALVQQVWLPAAPHRLPESQHRPLMQLCDDEQQVCAAPEPHTLVAAQQPPLTQL